MMGFDGVTTVESTSSTILTVNIQVNGTRNTVKFYFQIADSSYATHQAVMQVFNDAFTTRKAEMFGNYKLPALPLSGSGAIPNWVSAIYYS